MPHSPYSPLKSKALNAVIEKTVEVDIAGRTALRVVDPLGIVRTVIEDGHEAEAFIDELVDEGVLVEIDAVRQTHCVNNAKLGELLDRWIDAAPKRSGRAPV